MYQPHKLHPQSKQVSCNPHHLLDESDDFGAEILEPPIQKGYERILIRINQQDFSEEKVHSKTASTWQVAVISIVLAGPVLWYILSATVYSVRYLLSIGNN